MPAQVVLVDDELGFLNTAAEALRTAGHEVAIFSDPISALDAFKVARTADVLVSRMRFAPGMPNGISLASMIRYKRPAVRVLFTAEPKDGHHAEGIGDFVATPVNIDNLVTIVGRLAAKASATCA